MTTQPGDAMDPVRLQLLLTGVREALEARPGGPVEQPAGPRFRRAADSPLFADLLGTPDERPAAVVTPPAFGPRAASTGPLLTPTSLAAVIGQVH